MHTIYEVSNRAAVRSFSKALESLSARYSVLELRVEVVDAEDRPPGGHGRQATSRAKE